MGSYADSTIEILKSRYYLRDNKGELIENAPEQMFRRVAHNIAQAEITAELRSYWEEKFFNAMNNQLFMPNTPSLMNAGTGKCLSACSVLGRIPDTLEGIYEYISKSAKLTKFGLGIGFDLSAIRPKNSIIQSSGGKSAGVVNWMTLIQAMATTTIQGDKARRAANMVGLRFNHPDIFDFINCKYKNNDFSAINISVVITDNEMKKALNREEITLEWNGIEYDTVNAGDIYDQIIHNAHGDGDPGFLFLDRINLDNPFNLQDGNFDINNEHYITITNP